MRLRFPTWLFLLIPVLIPGFLFFEPWTGAGLDESVYYAQLTSMVHDGDLEVFNDQFLSNNQPRQQIEFAYYQTPDGHSWVLWPVGPALLWAPFHLLVHAFYRIADPSLYDPYRFPFLLAVSTGTLAYTALGVLLTWAALVRLGLRRGAGFAAVVTALASPAAYYMWIAGGMGHGMSMFAAALFLYTVVRMHRLGCACEWLWLGLAAGCMFLVRWQDVVFALAAAPFILRAIWRRGVWSRRTAVSLLCGAAGFLILAAIQLRAWKYVYGTWVAVPHAPEYFVGRWYRYVASLLFSDWNGLFNMTPWLAVGAIGLIVGLRRWPFLITTILGALALETVVNSLVLDWFGGNSFGARRFTSSVPFFAAGIGVLLNSPRLRRLRPLVYAAGVTSTAFNMLFIFAYQAGAGGGSLVLAPWSQWAHWRVLVGHFARHPLRIFWNSPVGMWLERGHPLTALGVAMCIFIIPVAFAIIVRALFRTISSSRRAQSIALAAFAAIWVLVMWKMGPLRRPDPAGIALSGYWKAETSGGSAKAEGILRAAKQIAPHSPKVLLAGEMRPLRTHKFQDVATTAVTEFPKLRALVSVSKTDPKDELSAEVRELVETPRYGTCHQYLSTVQAACRRVAKLRQFWERNLEASRLDRYLWMLSIHDDSHHPDPLMAMPLYKPLIRERALDQSAAPEQRRRLGKRLETLCWEEVRIFERWKRRWPDLFWHAGIVGYGATVELGKYYEATGATAKACELYALVLHGLPADAFPYLRERLQACSKAGESNTSQ